MERETEIALKNYDYLIRSKGVENVSLHFDIDTVVYGDGGATFESSILAPGFTPATREE